MFYVCGLLRILLNVLTDGWNRFFYYNVMHAQESILSICQHKHHQVWRFDQLVSIATPSKSSKNWLHYASNQLTRYTSIANAAFLLAMPIYCTHHFLSACAHNLMQYVRKGHLLYRCMLAAVVSSESIAVKISMRCSCSVSTCICFY